MFQASPVRQRFSWRAFLVLCLHAVAFSAVLLLAYNLRFDFAVPTHYQRLFWMTLPSVIVLKLLIFYWMGLCHGWWRYVTFSDLATLLRAATLSSLIILALDQYLVSANHVPRVILLLDWGLTILVLGGLRCAWRLSREQFRPMLLRGDVHRAFIVGANQAGESLVRQLQSDPRLGYSITGFLDDDAATHGSRLGGVQIVGTPEEGAQLAEAFSTKEILVISGSLPGKRLRGLMALCEESGVALKVLPAFDEMLVSGVPLQIRDVDINDLLRREPVELSTDDIGQMLAGRTVMVTGAGGSIGSEICRQVLRFHPAALVLVERAENNLFVIDRELQATGCTTQLHPVMADIVDRPRMTQIFGQFRPDIVFHAAAHKHVPMMEFNPGEAIKNNIGGTRQLVELAHEHGVGEFVMISTDKAVNPTSVMGVSKQLAERVVHAYSEVSSTKFVAVRFGNVLASAGSVVPIFMDQIRRGGPVTVTHPDIERFFMTIPEASQLVLQAAAMGRGGEIFVLDMGEPVRIVDLARDLIRLSGFDTDEIEVVFTGLRPGEKLYEELYFDSEEMMPTPHPKLFVAYHRPYSLDEVNEALQQLDGALHESVEVLRRKLKDLVPEYSLEPTHGAASSNGHTAPVVPVTPVAPDAVAKS